MKSSDSALVLEIGRHRRRLCHARRSRQRGPYQGEIYELYLDPVHQGLGLGEHLFEGCRHALDMRKLNGLIVWALLDNTQACDFYWRRGGRPVTSAFTKIGGERLGEGRLRLALTLRLRNTCHPGIRASEYPGPIPHIGLLPVAPSARGWPAAIEVARLAVGDAARQRRRLLVGQRIDVGDVAGVVVHHLEHHQHVAARPLAARCGSG